MVLHHTISITSKHYTWAYFCDSVPHLSLLILCPVTTCSYAYAYYNIIMTCTLGSVYPKREKVRGKPMILKPVDTTKELNPGDHILYQVLNVPIGRCTIVLW